MKIDIIVPVLGRPEHAKRFRDSYWSGDDWWTHKPRAFAICENELDRTTWLPYTMAYLAPIHHTFAEKVNWAYEHVVSHSDAEWVLLVGSDVNFHPGWIDRLEEALVDMPEACVLGTLDLLNAATMKGHHTCHPVIKRSYIDEVGASWDGPGKICSEAYRHNYVDNEIVRAAQDRGVWCPTEAVIEHLHPVNGKAEWDEVYQEGEQWKTLDSLTWSKRLRKYSI